MYSELVPTSERISSSTSQKKIGVIVKVARVFDCFNTMNTELSLAQLSRLCGMPKTTMVNIIRTLETEGYLDRVANTPNYKLGLKFLEKSYYVQEALPIIRLAAPYLEELLEETGQNVYLTTHRDGQLLYLHNCLKYSNKVKYSAAGRMLPLHSTAAGKAMMSHMSREEIEQIVRLQGLAARTPNTITNLDTLWNELQTAKRQGYALDTEEETIGICCVAMAITDAAGKPVGSVSVSGAKQNMTPDRIKDYVSSIIRVRDTLSTQARLFPCRSCMGIDT